MPEAARTVRKIFVSVIRSLLYLFTRGPEFCGGRTGIDYSEITRHAVFAHLKRIGLAIFAVVSCVGFEVGIVEFRVIGEYNRGAVVRGSLRHFLRGRDVAVVVIRAGI